MRSVRGPLLVLLAAVLGVGSCVGGEDPTGLRVAEVSLALQPALIPSAADGSALPVNRIRAVVLRQPDDVLLREQRFDVLPTAASWTIDVAVPVTSASIDVIVYVYLLHVTAEGTEEVQFSGRTDALAVSVGTRLIGVDADVVRGTLDNLLVTDVTITAYPDTIYAGWSGLLDAEVTADVTSYELFWTSLDPSVLALGMPDASGVEATGVAAGTAEVVASAGAHADTVIVVVAPAPVDSVRVSPDSADVQTGGTRSYTAQLLDANGNALSGRTVTWTTGNPSVATVSTSGVVTGVIAGTTTVRATSEGVFDEAVVRVLPAAVDSVRVTPDSADVQQGQTSMYAAQLFDAAGNTLSRPVTWTTGNASIATVDGAGAVTGLSVGTTTVRATSEGVFDEAIVRVTSAPAGGATISWDAGSGAWSVASNWSLDRVPAAGDTVRIEQGGDYTVTLDVDATIARLVVGGTSDVASLDVGGHTLAITGTSVGPELDIESLGRVDLDGGTIFVEDIANRGAIHSDGPSGIQTSLLLQEGDLVVGTGTLTIFHPSAGMVLASGDISIGSGAFLALAFNMHLNYSGGAVMGPGGFVMASGNEVELYADLQLTDGVALYLESGAIDGVEADHVTIEAGSHLFVSSLDGPSALDAKLAVEGTLHLITGTTTITDSLLVRPGGYLLAGGGASSTFVTSDVENFGVIALAGITDVTFGPGDAGMIVNRSTGIIQSVSTSLTTINGELLNEGVVYVAGPSQLRREDGTDTPVTANHLNDGTIVVAPGGSLDVVLGGSSPTFTNADSIEVQLAATLSVTNVATPPGAIVNEVTGILVGDGTVDVRSGVPSGINNGVIAPGSSPGLLTWLGSVPMGPTGTIEIEIDGPTPVTGHDQLTLSADLVHLQDVAGNLVVRATDFGVVDGDRFAVMTFRDRLGSFLSVELPTNVPDVTFDTLWTSHPGVDPDTLFIVATDASPDPPNLNRWLAAVDGDWETPTNWSKGAVPVAGDSVVIDALGTYVVTLSTGTTIASLTNGRAGSEPSLELAGPGHALVVTSGVRNAGYIELRDDSANDIAMELHAQGGLSNLANGVVVAFGAGDVPRIVGTVVNEGTIWTQSQPLIIASPDVGAHANYGLIDAVGGDIMIDLTQETTALDNYGRLLARSNRAIGFQGGSLNQFPGARIEGDGTLRLEGTVLANDGVIDPGIGTTGIFTIEGDSDWGSSSALFIELNGATPGAHDQLRHTGAVSFDGALVVTTSAFNPQDGARYAVMTFGQRAAGTTFASVDLPLVPGLTLDTVWAEAGTIDTLYIEASAGAGMVGQWGWLAGADSVEQWGVYGELGVPDPANTPGSRYFGTTWTDADGSLWLFGGIGYDAEGVPGLLNDLWRYDGEWTWMSGSEVANQPGSYGVLGEPNPGNQPGGRQRSAGWVDLEGNFWLFGGNGLDQESAPGFLNDLWRWDGTSWTWMAGTANANEFGAAGGQGIPCPCYYPGGRVGHVAWADADGNGWIFGGDGYDAGSEVGWLNDLWRWDGTQWAWMEGVAEGVNQPAVYGDLDLPDDANQPGARYGATAWSDVSGLWLFGGEGYTEGASGYLDDVWFYDVATEQWTWKHGTNGTDAVGEYPALGSAGNPGAREGAPAAVGFAGYVYMFGGSGWGADDAGGLNDLWRFDGVQWVYLGGSQNPHGIGSYGTLGEAAPGNLPGSRAGSMAWPGPAGLSIWLFGGEGYADESEYGLLNDLWRYTP